MFLYPLRSFVLYSWQSQKHSVLCVYSTLNLLLHCCFIKMPPVRLVFLYAKSPEAQLAAANKVLFYPENPTDVVFEQKTLRLVILGKLGLPDILLCWPIMPCSMFHVTFVYFCIFLFEPLHMLLLLFILTDINESQFMVKPHVCLF